MKKLTKQMLLCAVLFSLLGTSCRKELIEPTPPQLSTIQNISIAKKYVDSVVLHQGANAFIKKMAFDISWEKAIIDSAGNVRVPISLNLSKLKPLNGIKNVSRNIEGLFELYVKKNNGKLEASIMEFISIKDKYYPLRYSLTGEIKTKLLSSTSTQDSEMLTKNGGVNKFSPSPLNKIMMYDSEFMQLIQSSYGSYTEAVIIKECPAGFEFNPETCFCDYPNNILGSSGMYPELFMYLITGAGTYQLVPYPYSFHPSSIIPDPTYPNEPIDNGSSSPPIGDGEDDGSSSEAELISSIMDQTTSVESSSDDFTVNDLYHNVPEERKKAYEWTIAYNPFVYWKVISHETGTHKKVNGECQWKVLEHNNFSVIDNIPIIDVTVTENGQAIPTIGIYYAGIEVGCNVKARIIHQSIPLGASPKNYRKNSPLFFSNTP